MSSLPLACQRPVAARGFTLIELMVVLVIIATMAALLVIGGGDSAARKLQREAEGLAALLNLAADEAVMQGIELGLYIDDNGYRFLQLHEESGLWQEIEQKPLQRRDFERAYPMQFELDGERLDERQRAKLQALARRVGGDEQLVPMLLLLSSGEVTPFRLTLALDEGGQTMALGSDGLNPVSVGPADDEDEK